MRRTTKPIKLSFWDSNNFGDALNTYMFRAFGIEANPSRPNNADIIGIGSCVDSRLLLGGIEKKIPDNQDPISIYGSGFHYPKYNHPMQKHIVKPETLIRPIITHALRGEVSKKRLESILGRQLENVALGDPGLLISDIFDFKGIKKKYKLGIVAHFIYQNHPSLKRIKNTIDNSIIINVLGNPYKIAKQIAECEVLVSSAMHPLIIADGLGIPNRWLNFSKFDVTRKGSNHKEVSQYKFIDYYSIFNLEPKFIDLSERDFTLDDIEEIKSNYSIKRDDVNRIKENLIKAFPYSDTIKPLSKREANMMYYSFLFRASILKVIKQIISIFIPNRERRREFRASPIIK